MFGRKKPEPISESPAEGEGRPERKGRPTPTRKEAEAAARARAKADAKGNRTRKEQAAAQRAARAQGSAKMREAMRTGDDRYLPTRDKGPVKRFVRDYVDHRFSFTELLIPLLLVTMFLGWSGRANLIAISNSLTFGIILLVVIDSLLLRFRLRKELVRRFGAGSVKGTTYYAIVRALQPRFLRMPKSQVKIGQRLPEHYR